MDLLRTLLVYMSVLVSSAGVNSPALTPVPQSTVTPAPTAWVTQSPLPSAAPTATSTPAMTTLSMNSRGEEVTRLQQRLLDLGYLKGKVDGIFGKQTLEAVRNFQRNNKLTVDGIAGRNTLNKLYNDAKVVPAAPGGATVRPISAQLPVYYVSTTGATFNTDTLSLAPGTRTVTPNLSKVPNGYTLRSQRSVSVRVSNNGVATPSSITFTYQPPALVQTVNVPIFYRSDSNQLLSQDYVAAPYGQTMSVFAQQNRVPQGFKLLTPAQLSVSVNAQGVPTPGSLTFIYRGPQVVNAVVPVFYRNTQGDLLTSHMMSLQPGPHTIAVNDALVPQGYTLEGAREQSVTVSEQGTANPATITFTFRTSAVTVSLPVQYVDQNGGMLKQDSVSVMTGANTVTANDALVPGYELTSARQVSVQVDSNGRATPDKVVFTYKKPAQATVAVLYRGTDGKALLDTSVTFPEGTHTVIANDSFVPAGYTLESAREVPVTVKADGSVTPTTITFTYKAPAAPTAQPTASPTPKPTVSPTPPVTEAPVTEEPVTEAPVTEAPVTEAPVTEEPVTEEPVTEVPVTEAPVTEAPATEEPAPPTAPALQAYVERTIPQGEYPMHTGPSDSYIQSTPNQVFSGGDVRMWGSQAGWVMIGYDLDGQGNYRVGYIPKSLLPAEVDVPELQLPFVETMPIVQDGVALTEDPFGNNTTLQLPLANGKKVMVYGLVDNWAYVESVTDLARGFVPKAALGIQ